jgi:3-hydroxyisobutyrate dehydrogenase-like beta-hydroxyacid dehydrogenase
MTISIGFIGAGNMGRPFVLALLQRGFTVTVHDHDPACERSAATVRNGRTVPH